MQTTLDYFIASKGSRAFAHTSQPGRIPLEQAIEAMDTLSSIFVTCAHVLDGNGSDVALYDPPMNRVRQSSKLTIPQCQRILRAWNKWTFHPSQLAEGIPSLPSVISFLHDEALKA